MARYLGKNLWYITDPTGLQGILAECLEAQAVSFDTETTRSRNLPNGLTWDENLFKPGLDPFVSEIRLLQLATTTDIYVIDLWYCPDIRLFAPLFMSSTILKIGMNLKFDIKMLMNQFGFDFRNIFDVMLASQLIYNGKHSYFRKHNLYEITLREMGISLDKGLQKSDWGSETLSKEQINYSAIDVDVLHDLCLLLGEKLHPKDVIINPTTGERLDLRQTMRIENDACIATARMELEGIYVDPTLWAEYDTQIRSQFFDIRATIREMIGDVNLESPKQLTSAFARLGVSVTSTDAETLERLSSKVPLAAALSLYRGLAKLLSSYGNGIPGKARRKIPHVADALSVYFIERIHPLTGRIHSSYGQLNAETGRYNSDKPNVQNVVSIKKAPFRHAFRGQGDNVFIIADLEQFETRALCSLAEDENLRTVILDRSSDTHTKTASLMYHVPEDTIMTRDPDTGKKVKGINAWMRDASKAIAFGWEMLGRSKTYSNQWTLIGAEYSAPTANTEVYTERCLPQRLIIGR